MIQVVIREIPKITVELLDDAESTPVFLDSKLASCMK